MMLHRPSVLPSLPLLGALLLAYAPPAHGLPGAPLRPISPSSLRMPRVTPLERSTAADLALRGGLPPEDLAVVRSKADGDHVIHATGYIHAPLSAVWAAFHDPDLVVSRRKVDSWTTQMGTDPSCDLSYRIREVASRSLVTVNFDITWRFEISEGTPAAPKVIIARGSKTAGTSYIRKLEDSIVATQVGLDVTRLEIVRHQNVMFAGFTEAEDYVRDVFASIRAKVHGQPLPDCK